MSWDELEERFGGHHFDRTGAPITFQRWAHLRRQRGYVRVAEDKAGPYLVVTQWLGQAASPNVGEGPPPIFETSVYAPDATPEQRDTYTSEAQALAGHRRIVRAARVARAVTVFLLIVFALAAVALAGIVIEAMAPDEVAGRLSRPLTNGRVPL